MSWAIIKTSGFETLKSIGMDIIQKDSLRSMIGEYYTTTIYRTKETSDILSEDFNNYILKFIRTLFISQRDKNNKRIQIPVNYDDLLENIEYVESLKSYSQAYRLYLNASKRYLNETKVLKREIEAYLIDK